jgi:hypothetical protein
MLNSSIVNGNRDVMFAISDVLILLARVMRSCLRVTSTHTE